MLVVVIGTDERFNCSFSISRDELDPYDDASVRAHIDQEYSNCLGEYDVLIIENDNVINNF